jgi:hypothetical protein
MPRIDVWTHEEMILVLNLYLKLPFGKMDRRNPDVIHLAYIIGRTPNAVALRLVNYASYDPQLQQRGISGMAHGGKKCGEYWHKFINDRERLLFESERILAQREGTTIEKKFEQDMRDIPQGIIGETKERVVKTRVNQNVFRQIVLANYDGKCALTGIDLSELACHSSQKHAEYPRYLAVSATICTFASSKDKKRRWKQKEYYYALGWIAMPRRCLNTPVTQKLGLAPDGHHISLWKKVRRLSRLSSMLNGCGR